MKIVHLCLCSFFIDNYSYQENMFPKYHHKMGYDVTVLASLMSFDSNGKGCYLEKAFEYQDANGFQVKRLNYKRPIKLYRVLKRYVGVYKELEIEAPDIIFIHGLQFSDLNQVIKYKKHHPNVKLFADNHADYVNSAHGFVSTRLLHKCWWRFQIHKALPYLEKCYGVTPLRCDFLHKMYGIPNEKIEYLPLGVDDEAVPQNREEVRTQICRDLSIPSDSFIIVTGGKIDEKKNIHLLLQAIKDINDPSIHVLICGTVMPEMKAVIESLLTGNVHLLGWCNDSQVMNCMIASDLACFPGTHSTLWEQSIGVGLPLIAKKWKGMEHINVCGNCELLEFDTVEEIRSALTKSVYKRAYYNVLKQNADAAKDKFRYSDIAVKSIS